VGVVALVLVVCAVALLLGVEWPALTGRFASRVPAPRRRARSRAPLRLVEDDVGDRDDGDRDDFARSVARDLDNLPVLGEPDEPSRR
jgi:hypothetical protein